MPPRGKQGKGRGRGRGRGGGRPRGSGRGGGRGASSATPGPSSAQVEEFEEFEEEEFEPSDDEGSLYVPSSPFIPVGGWESGGVEPPWEAGTVEAVGPCGNPFRQEEDRYISPFVNLPDGNRVVESQVDDWDIIGGNNALAPRVMGPPVPQRDLHWQGPQPTAIPLPQQFDREAMDWMGETPPTMQEQRGQPRMPRGRPARSAWPPEGEMRPPPTQWRPPLQYYHYGQPQQQQQQQMIPQQFLQPQAYYGHRNLQIPRPVGGPTYQQLYYPLPGGQLGGTVWEQQGLVRPPGPLTWKDTRAYGPGVEGGFDPAVIQQLESGDLEQYANLEAIDEGPRKPNESVTAWRARVVTTRAAIGIQPSEIRGRPYTFPGTAKMAGDTPEQVKARLAARRKLKAQWEKDKEIHKNKMDHTHKNFDPDYAAQYRAEKAARQFQNQRRRKTALMVARRIAERDNQPRPGTPELPEDSSDEDLPAMPPRNRGAGAPGPKGARCLYCKHMRKTCSLVTGSPRPCDRCKTRGIVCEITRDLEDPKSAKPSWKMRPKRGPSAALDESEEEDEDEDEEDEPITAQEKASLLRKKRAMFNQRSTRGNPLRKQRRRSVTPPPEALPSRQCAPCKDQSRPCDGETPCGTCKLNGTVDMCSDVSCFARYRERDYRDEEGPDLEGAIAGIDWGEIDAFNEEVGFSGIIDWDGLANNPEDAEKATQDMDLGPMMNYSSNVIMESLEIGHQNNFFLQNADNDLPAMDPFQPDPEGPSFNRLATVVEPNASYNSLAPERPEFLAEPFGDVAHFADATFGGERMDFGSPEIQPQNSVERPDDPDDGLDTILSGVERQRAGGFQVATLRGDPDPDPHLKGPVLANYAREWKQNLKGLLNNKHCDELIGIDICFKSPAKHCDYLQHMIEGGDWFTCVPCHKDQNVRVADVQQMLIEYTKLYYCNECVAEQRPRTRRSAVNPAFRKEYCTCTSQLRKSWLCNRHRDEAMDDVKARSLAVKNWMARRNILRCNGCDQRALGDKSGMWACSSCREIVYV